MSAFPGACRSEAPATWPDATLGPRSRAPQARSSAPMFSLGRRISMEFCLGEVRDPHTDHTRHRRAESDRQRRSIEQMTAPLDPPGRRVHGHPARHGLHVEHLRGIGRSHTWTQQPTTIGGLHEQAPPVLDRSAGTTSNYRAIEALRLAGDRRPLQCGTQRPPAARSAPMSLIPRGSLEAIGGKSMAMAILMRWGSRRERPSNEQGGQPSNVEALRLIIGTVALADIK